MRVEVNKNELAGALIALGKLVCRTAPMQVFKCLRIEVKLNQIRFSTCSLTEQIAYKLPIPEGTEGFYGIVGFDEFRDAVRSCRNKVLVLESGKRMLTVGDRTLSLQSGVEWLTPKTGTHCSKGTLPKSFVEILSSFAAIVNRNEPRTVLRGINFSTNGITATNGKELLNLPIPDLNVADLTIPLPIALMQTKSEEEGTLDVWEDKAYTKTFSIETAHRMWVAKALNGTYPNWQKFIPEEKELARSVKIDCDHVDGLLLFLKSVPDVQPHNATKLCSDSKNMLRVECGDIHRLVPATFTGNWHEANLILNKELLLRLLSEGHSKISLYNGYAPFAATGGIGQYIGMPLTFVKPQAQTEPEVSKITQPKQEENKMENTVTRTASTPTARTFTQNTNTTPETEAVTNPLDDLGNCIEAFKLKLRSALDESVALARKVKEAQLIQKQKEREFIHARRALERVRMAV